MAGWGGGGGGAGGYFCNFTIEVPAFQGYQNLNLMLCGTCRSPCS